MELEEQEHTAESHAAFMAAIAVADAADAVDAAARAAARDDDRVAVTHGGDSLMEVLAVVVLPQADLGVEEVDVLGHREDRGHHLLVEEPV